MIDWTKVTELREEIGDEDFQEVVELFLEEVDGAGEPIGQSLHRRQGELRRRGLRTTGCPGPFT